MGYPHREHPRSHTGWSGHRRNPAALTLRGFLLQPSRDWVHSTAPDRWVGVWGGCQAPGAALDEPSCASSLQGGRCPHEVKYSSVLWTVLNKDSSSFLGRGRSLLPFFLQPHKPLCRGCLRCRGTRQAGPGQITVGEGASSMLGGLGRV